ncbi:MAG: acetyl-CoA carboxylase carboxyl transferase subunit alpha [Kordiimonas sp.]|mgnify:CR=1 FL=1|nr:acetyl-CoA carboxylase carboxyl transferase subunit alpha [Kordiimonas sp.]
MITFLDFEKPIAELESKIRELRDLESGDAVNIAEEVKQLEKKLDKLLRETYANLDAWQKTQVARHPNRLHLPQYIAGLIDDFVPLAGDRAFADDQAINGGIGRFKGQSVMVIGHEKGEDTESRIRHNFAMARPEGYRKAIRLMDLADRFGLPVITFVDTPGAYPGIGAEERGQAEAIARSTEKCLDLKVPMIAIIVGEGGSGGAVALGAGNKVLMLEHAVYSVISPEGCASILWRTGDKAADAANALKITAQDLKKLGVIDDIVPEPVGGVHRDYKQTLDSLSKAIDKSLTEMAAISGDKLRDLRREKFLAMGHFNL